MTAPALLRPGTVDEAVRMLANADGTAAPLAGGTWVMRAGLRGEASADHVLVGHLPELARLDVDGDTVVIGAGVSHDRLGRWLAGCRGLEALAEAARRSANPAVRRMATVGGNLCAVGFPAPDLVPPLLALSATVVVRDADGSHELDVAGFLGGRAASSPGTLVTHVRLRLPGPGEASAHERLTLRHAGDYPVATVSAAVHVEDGSVAEAVVAVGSVEPVPRRWDSLAAALAGSPLDPSAAESAARDLVHELAARDGVEAAGWYRTQVLPTLVRRAVETLERRTGRP